MRTLCLAGLLGLAFSLLAPLGAGADLAQPHVDLALRLMRKGRLRDARLELDTAKALAPDRPDIRELIVSLEQPNAAAPVSGSAAAIAPADPRVPAQAGLGARLEAPLARAREAYRLSDLKAAAAAWREVLALVPTQDEAVAGLKRMDQEAYKRDADQPFDQSVADLYDAGLREMRKGRLLEARHKLEDAKALNPAQAQVLRALGMVAAGAADQKQGRDAESLVLDGQRFAADGEDAKAAAAFAAALQASPGLQAAEQGLTLVQGRNSAKVQAACAKGAAALQRKDWDAAEQAYSLALSLDPRHQGAKDGHEQAKAHLADQRGLASRRRDADRLYNSGVEAWQGGDLAMAASRFRETLTVAPDDVEATKALQAVRRKLDERAGKDRTDAAALLAEGRTLEQRGALDEALQRYGRAFAKDPGLAEAAEAKSSLEKKVKGL